MQACDLLCQAKLVAANPGNSWGCTTGVYCRALVNAWSDSIVALLNSLTQNNNVALLAGGVAGPPRLAQPGTAPGYVLQTFELGTAEYVIRTFPMAIVCFLFQQRGADLSTVQPDPFLGHYPASLSITAGGEVLPALGGRCGWCVNGTSPGGWADVNEAISAGGDRMVGGISLSDLVVSQARHGPPPFQCLPGLLLSTCQSSMCASPSFFTLSTTVFQIPPPSSCAGLPDGGVGGGARHCRARDFLHSLDPRTVFGHVWVGGLRDLASRCLAKLEPIRKHGRGVLSGPPRGLCSGLRGHGALGVEIVEEARVPVVCTEHLSPATDIESWRQPAKALSAARTPR